MTLTEFLTARLDEDEAAARAGEQRGNYTHYGSTAASETLFMALSEGCAEAGAEHFKRWLPARVLAEVEAKRRIVDWWMAGRDGNESGFDTRRLLGLLALPYADHPDYDEEWRL